MNHHAAGTRAAHLHPQSRRAVLVAAAALALLAAGPPAAAMQTCTLATTASATAPATTDRTPVRDLDDPGTPAPRATATASYTTYRWGTATWLEPTLGCRQLRQVFDFWPAQAGDPLAAHPTIVFFHANGATQHIAVGSYVYANVVAPALAAGYHVASVEFRHPVADQYLAPTNGGQVFHQDVGLAIQYLRAHAAKLKISPDNLFAFGQSRGSLVVWQAMQPDMGGPGTGLPSSRVSAVVSYQAQTTYQCQEFADLFIDPTDPARPDWVQGCETDNPYWPQFGSAIQSVTASAPPVMLQYRQDFVLVPGTQQIQPISVALLESDYDPGHYPDEGVALYDAYVRAGNPGMPWPQALVPSGQAFLGWQTFIAPYLR